MLTPPILFPFVDCIHATILCKDERVSLVLILIHLTVWLRPSKQICAPLYSFKRKQQRRWIVGVNARGLNMTLISDHIRHPLRACSHILRHPQQPHPPYELCRPTTRTVFPLPMLIFNVGAAM